MIEAFFKPESIAVIGASKDPRKVGHAVLSNLMHFNYEGTIYPINPEADNILGLKAHPRASSVGKPIGLAVIAVPAQAVPDTLLDCAAAGTNAAVILSAGFREAGAGGLKLEEQVKEISAKHRMRILGPNCLGVINTANNMNASFAGAMLPKGRTAFFSQSGALGIAILDWALGNNMGFSKFISLGNKTDLDETDFIEYFSSDPDTDVILGYIEDVVDGRRFLEAAKKATKLKPLILIKSGGTVAGARAASSHTGALAGSDTAFSSAFRQAGVIRAQGIEDLFDTAVAFASPKLPAGDGLLIVTNAGGPGILAADAAERVGIRLPIMTREAVEAIGKMLPSNSSLYNPVDIIGDATSERYAAVLSNAIKDPNIAAVLVILTPQAMTDVENVADVIIHADRETDKPVIASFIGEVKVRASIEKLKANSIPSFSYPETAIKSFKRLCDFKVWKETAEDPAPVTASNRAAAQEAINAFLKGGRFEAGDDAAMTILSHYGFTFPERALARTAKEAAAIAERIGFPLAMKISSPDILHKTDVGGVMLDVNSEIAAEDAFTEITAGARRAMPDAVLNGVMMYEMIKGGKEVILGVTYDRTFGHMLMFGLGGIYVEILKDVSFRIAPVTRSEAKSMISDVRASALLKGARGEKPSDIEAVVDGILKLSSIVSDFPVIRELDINPLMVLNNGAFVIDARIIFKRT
jgi:acetyl coenzyme A synthetase (ADP forming)-like protein